MPPANQYEQKNVRLMVFGKPKTGKTTWALKAALRGGFKILALNGDNGIGNNMMAEFSDEEKSKAMIINCADKGAQTNFVYFLDQLMKRQKIVWNDTLEEFSVMGGDPQHAYTVIQPNLMGKDWIILIDTYSKLVQSTTNRHALDNNIDLSAAKRNDWDGYGFQGRFLDWVLQKQGEFNSHFITIAHATDHVKRSSRKGAGGNWESVETPEGTWPYSSSKPHSKTIGAQFTDILFSYIQLGNAPAVGQPPVSECFLDARHLPERQGGARNLANGVYKMNDVDFSHLTTYRGNVIEQSPEEAVKYYPPGTYQGGSLHKPSITKPTADTAQQTPITVPKVNI